MACGWQVRRGCRRRQREWLWPVAVWAWAPKGWCGSPVMAIVQDGCVDWNRWRKPCQAMGRHDDDGGIRRRSPSWRRRFGVDLSWHQSSPCNGSHWRTSALPLKLYKPMVFDEVFTILVLFLALRRVFIILIWFLLGRVGAASFRGDEAWQR